MKPRAARPASACAAAIAAALFLVAVVPALAAAAGDQTLRRLDGMWQAPGLMLQIDSARLQARTDPDRPFSWQPLIIQNITGNMVVFSIGDRSFIGLFDQERLTVTSPQLAGSFSLTRREP